MHRAPPLPVLSSLALLVLLALSPSRTRAEDEPAEPSCPKGAELSGKAPPDDVERGCATKSGERNGPWTQWWPNGARWREGEYRSGKPHGRFTAWRPSGKKLYELEYKGGFLNGPAIVYWDTEQKRVEGSFSFGKPNGRWVAFAADGKEIGQLLFDAGKVRPRSPGNPKVADHMPKRARADVLRPMLAKSAAVADVGKTLRSLGRSPKPSKLEGEKATQFEEQSRWLVETGERLLLHVRAAKLLEAELGNPVQTGTDEEGQILQHSLSSAIKTAKRESSRFKSISATASLRHGSAQTALRKLEE